MSTFFLVRTQSYYTKKNNSGFGRQDDVIAATKAARKLCDETGQEHRVYEVRLVGAMRPRSKCEWVAAQEMDLDEMHKS